MDREFNSTPFDSSRNLNMTLVCAIIGVPISYICSHIRFNKTVKSNSIVSTCNNYINCNCEFQLASINCSIYIQWIKAN